MSTRTVVGVLAVGLVVAGAWSVFSGPPSSPAPRGSKDPPLPPLPAVDPASEKAYRRASAARHALLREASRKKIPFEVLVAPSGAAPTLDYLDVEHDEEAMIRWEKRFKEVTAAIKAGTYRVSRGAILIPSDRRGRR